MKSVHLVNIFLLNYTGTDFRNTGKKLDSEDKFKRHSTYYLTEAKKLKIL